MYIVIETKKEEKEDTSLDKEDKKYVILFDDIKGNF